MSDRTSFELRKLVAYEGSMERRPTMWDRWIWFARLVRLPNVFTAPADVLAGYWLLAGAANPRLPDSLQWAAIGSCMLYIAGMIFNDIFDLDDDRRDRPDRPLPSGNVPLPLAMFLGAAALASGVAAVAAGAAMAAGAVWILAMLVLLYNWKLKSTAAGPVTMGACRAVNMQLGMAIAWNATQGPAAAGAWSWVPPIASGIYIAGVSLLARNEVHSIEPRPRTIAICALAAGLLLHPMVWIGSHAPHAGAAVAFLLIYAGWLTYPLIRVVDNPDPPTIQSAVKTGILGIIAIDAAIATAFVGPLVGVFVLLLLVPAVYLGHWIYST